MAFADVGDLVSLGPGDMTFDVTGPFADGVPADETNLAVRARDAFLAATPMAPFGLTLDKRLPPASGIGGGSSDAAAVLRLLQQRSPIAEDELFAIALGLGADVPACLKASALMAGGRGEVITPAPLVPPLPAVLVNPLIAVSTAEVFNALASRDNDMLPPLPSRIDFHSIRNWLEITRNDLEPAARAFQPAIGKALSVLNKAGAGFARMSGSGATCFGLFETGNVAKRAAVDIRSRHPDWFVAATRSMTSEADAHG